MIHFRGLPMLILISTEVSTAAGKIMVSMAVQMVPPTDKYTFTLGTVYAIAKDTKYTKVRKVYSQNKRHVMVFFFSAIKSFQMVSKTT